MGYSIDICNIQISARWWYRRYGFVE